MPVKETFSAKFCVLFKFNINHLLHQFPIVFFIQLVKKETLVITLGFEAEHFPK